MPYKLTPHALIYLYFLSCFISVIMNSFIIKLYFVIVSIIVLPYSVPFILIANVEAGEYESGGIEPEVYVLQANEETEVSNSEEFMVSGGIVPHTVSDAKGAIKAGELGKAAEIVNEILTINPANEKALILRDKITELQHKDTIVETRSINSEELKKNIESLEEQSIPYTEKMRFPADEDQKIIKKRTILDRAMSFEESKDDTSKLSLTPHPQKPLPANIENALNKHVSIEFYDTPLSDVVAFIQEKADNINIIVDKEVGGIAVNIKLNDVPLHIVLKHLLPEGVSYRIEDDIVFISNDIFELRVYDVRDLLINLDDSTAGSGGDNDEGSGNSGSGGSEENRTPNTRVQELIRLITEVVEPLSWTVGGRITTREDKPGDLIVVNVESVHKQIEDILTSMRSAQHIQVYIEARFIQMSDKFLEDIGVELQNGLISTDPFNQENASFSVDTSAGGAGSALSQGLDLTYSILKDYQIDMVLNAVQESNEAQTLTSPRITLSNTQRGVIRVVNEISYVETYEIISSVPQPRISTVEDGTTFDVRPVVSTDRKHVFLEVHPNITTVTFADLPFNVVADISNGTGDPLIQTFPLIIQQPLISRQELSVTVDIPDRGTLMIGGLGTTRKATRTGGVPILSKIPILKRLFSRDSETVEKTNLIILLKPTILIREEEEKVHNAKTTEM